MTIVTTVHRYERPPKKRKAVAIEAAIVRKSPRSPQGLPHGGENQPEPAAPLPPANDDRKPLSQKLDAVKPAIVTTASRKRAKLLRFEQAAEPEDPEATARVRAFLDRMICPRG
jgi:hypothetical protein